MRPPSLLAVATLLGSVAVATPSPARTWRVPADAPTIQAGIDSAVAGDVVEVACDTYFEAGIDMKPAITLRSETGLPDCVTIDGLQRDRVINCKFVPGGEAVIEGLTVTGGSSLGPSYNGGGLRCYNASMIVRDCIFRNNESNYGGGVFVAGYHSHATVQLIDCTFWQNWAVEIGDTDGYGGGLFVGIQATVEVSRCTFAQNRASHGGGLCWSSRFPTPTLRQCTITDNLAFLEGGGVSLLGHSLAEAEETTIRDNIAPSGADGYVSETCGVLLTCCDVDLAAWDGEGEITVVDEDCGVGSEPATWGRVKVLYR